MKILESLNKTLPYEECEQECVAKEIEGTGLVEELAKLDPSTLTAALSNPGQHQQTFDPVLDKVVGSALAVTDACRPTTTACFKCIKVCHLQPSTVEEEEKWPLPVSQFSSLLLSLSSCSNRVPRAKSASPNYMYTQAIRKGNLTTCRPHTQNNDKRPGTSN